METVIKKLQPYAKYKASGVEWLGEIPEDWAVKKFKFIFHQSKGLTITKQNLIEKGVFCVNYGEIHSKFGFELDTDRHKLKCVSEEYLITDANSLLNKGDFVFADTSEDIEGSGNFTHLISDDKTFAGYHTIIVRPQTELISLYFAFVFDSDSFRNQIRKKVKGVKVYSITQAVLKETNVWLPSLEEQTAIAEFLDDKTTKIDQAISIKQQQIELLKERRQILIHKAVTQGINPDVKLKYSGVEWIGMIPEGWEVKRLASFGKFSKGGGFSKADLVEDGLQCILYGDIYTRYDIQITAVKRFIDNNKIKTSILLNEDDLLFTGSGETKEDIGKCVVFKNKVTTVAGGDVIIFKQKENHSLYLSYVLNTEGAKSEKARYSKGEIIVHTYGSKLRNIYVPIPPLSEQKEISAYIENATNKIATAISLKEQEIEKLKEYKSSLIDGVVTGKVRVC